MGKLPQRTGDFGVFSGDGSCVSGDVSLGQTGAVWVVFIPPLNRLFRIIGTGNHGGLVCNFV